jgi:hypothetical protein
VGPWVFKEALDTFIRSNGKDVPIGMAGAPPPLFFHVTLLRAARGAILEILDKINRVDFFHHEVKILIRAHV